MLLPALDYQHTYCICFCMVNCSLTLAVLVVAQTEHGDAERPYVALEAVGQAFESLGRHVGQCAGEGLGRGTCLHRQFAMCVYMHM